MQQSAVIGHTCTTARRESSFHHFPLIPPPVIETECHWEADVSSVGHVVLVPVADSIDQLSLRAALLAESRVYRWGRIRSPLVSAGSKHSETEKKEQTKHTQATIGIWNTPQVMKHSSWATNDNANVSMGTSTSDGQTTKTEFSIVGRSALTLFPVFYVTCNEVSGFPTWTSSETMATMWVRVLIYLKDVAPLCRRHSYLTSGKEGVLQVRDMHSHTLITFSSLFNPIKVYGCVS